MSKIILVAHNIRSTHNVGSLLRTADCLGVDIVYLTGYTPYPIYENDQRLPHISNKLDAQIHKTALGAERTVKWLHAPEISNTIKTLRMSGIQVVALEQAKGSIALPQFSSTQNIAIIVGNEVTGLDASVLDMVDSIVEIPMSGAKESLNVAQASAICLYHLRFINISQKG
jgi:tRNA G18 (ribose-2'-O)-methylase SpoU